MREYINVYQLDDIGNDKVRFDDYLLISKNALSYKFRVGELRDFVIDGIDTTLPIYNANQLMGYGLNFTPPLRNYQLLTFDELSNSWVNRELDIDAVFRFSKFEPNKFLRLDASNKVITSDVYVSDLVVDTPLKADHFLKVDVSGSSIEYVDVYAYIDNAIDTKSGTFIPLLNAEIDRATNEEIRIESLLNSEIDRATNEEIRIENKFDTLINTEITRIENDLNTVGTDLRTDLENEILRATNEEIRIETLLSTVIQDEEDRAVEEERRLEELIRAGLQSASNDLNDVSDQLNDALQAEINRATAEEIRIEGLINNERDRAISEESRIEQLIQDEIDRATNAESSINTYVSNIYQTLGDDIDDVEALISSYWFDWFNDNSGVVTSTPSWSGRLGWTRFPSGFTIQGGSGISGPGGIRDITFPVPFSDDGSFAVVITERAASGWIVGSHVEPTIYGMDIPASNRFGFRLYASRVVAYSFHDSARMNPGMAYSWIAYGF